MSWLLAAIPFLGLLDPSISPPAAGRSDAPSLALEKDGRFGAIFPAYRELTGNWMHLRSSEGKKVAFVCRLYRSNFNGLIGDAMTNSLHIGTWNILRRARNSPRASRELLTCHWLVIQRRIYTRQVLRRVARWEQRGPVELRGGTFVRVSSRTCTGRLPEYRVQQITPRRHSESPLDSWTPSFPIWRQGGPDGQRQIQR